jgi:hypothetical protein
MLQQKIILTIKFAKYFIYYLKLLNSTYCKVQSNCNFIFLFHFIFCLFSVAKSINQLFFQYFLFDSY